MVLLAITAAGGLLAGLAVVATGVGSGRDFHDAQLTGEASAQDPYGGPYGSYGNCPNVQFFGVRGSGETDAYGTTVGAFAAELSYRLSQAGVNYNAEPINYPAVAVGYAGPFYYSSAYKNSVAAGENQLETALIRFWHACPGHEVILAGYSQGAQVAGDIADALKPGYRKLVAAVVLFGDARFNPDQKRVDVGTYQHYYGVYEVADWRTRVVPGDLAGKFQSVCLKGDPVCNFNSVNVAACKIHPDSCPHVLYVQDGWTAAEAKWAAGKV